MVKKRYKVIWNKQAIISLRSIYNYIRNRESTEQAARVRDEIRDLGRSLGFMPHKYVKDQLLENESDQVRYKVIWSYRIIYEVKEESVAILDIIHTSRSPKNINIIT